MARKLTVQEVAFTTCFTALYVVLSFLPIFPILGFFGKTITVAAVIAPIIGIILGPYLGITCTFLGGVVGLFLNPLFSPPSFVSGIVAASFAGLLFANRRAPCALTYLGLLAALGFYPSVGPVWLYPPEMWFQILGFLLLISPLQSVATKDIASGKNAKFLLAFFITSLTSTLASQIAGSLVFEMVNWPSLMPEIGAWQALWTGLAFVYPAERTTIAILAALIGAAVYKALKTTSLPRVLNYGRRI